MRSLAQKNKIFSWKQKVKNGSFWGWGMGAIDASIP